MAFINEITYLPVHSITKAKCQFEQMMGKIVEEMKQ